MARRIQVSEIPTLTSQAALVAKSTPELVQLQTNLNTSARAASTSGLKVQFDQLAAASKLVAGEIALRPDRPVRQAGGGMGSGTAAPPRTAAPFGSDVPAPVTKAAAGPDDGRQAAAPVPLDLDASSIGGYKLFSKPTLVVFKAAENAGMEPDQFLYNKEPGAGLSPNLTEAQRKEARDQEYITHYKPKSAIGAQKANAAFCVLLIKTIKELRKNFDKFGAKARFQMDRDNDQKIVVSMQDVDALENLLEKRQDWYAYITKGNSKREKIVLNADEVADLQRAEPLKYANYVFRTKGGRTVLTGETVAWLNEEVATGKDFVVPNIGNVAVNNPKTDRAPNSYYPAKYPPGALVRDVIVDGSYLLTEGLTTRSVITNLVRLSLKAAGPKTSAKETVDGKEKQVTRTTVRDNSGMDYLLRSVPPLDFRTVVSGRKETKEWFPNDQDVLLQDGTYRVGFTLNELMTDHYGNAETRAKYNSALGLTSVDITALVPFLTKHKGVSTFTPTQTRYLGAYNADLHGAVVAETDFLRGFSEAISQAPKLYLKANKPPAVRKQGVRTKPVSKVRGAASGIVGGKGRGRK